MTRNPQRIPAIIGELQKLWEKNPEKSLEDLIRLYARRSDGSSLEDDAVYKNLAAANGTPIPEFDGFVQN